MYLIRPNKPTIIIILALEINLYFTAFSNVNDSQILNAVFLFIMFSTAIFLIADFEFRIGEDKLLYRIKLMGFSIRKKEIPKGDIEAIQLQKSNKWTNIEVSDGSNVKVSDHKYKEMRPDLIDFAKRNNIIVEEV